MFIYIHTIYIYMHTHTIYMYIHTIIYIYYYIYYKISDGLFLAAVDVVSNSIAQAMAATMLSKHQTPGYREAGHWGSRTPTLWIGLVLPRETIGEPTKMGYKWITTWQKSVLDGWMVLVYPVTQTRLVFSVPRRPWTLLRTWMPWAIHCPPFASLMTFQTSRNVRGERLEMVGDGWSVMEIWWDKICTCGEEWRLGRNEAHVHIISYSSLMFLAKHANLLWSTSFMQRHHWLKTVSSPHKQSSVHQPCPALYPCRTRRLNRVPLKSKVWGLW